MVISVRRWMQRVKFIAMFLVGTYVLVELFTAVNVWIAPIDKYRIPQGRAVKAFHHDPDLTMQADTFAERLRLFYWMGE